MKKITKILAVLSIYFFLLIIDGCVNCKCPDNILRFFDFQNLKQDISNNILSSNQKLDITLSFDDITYLAQLEKPCWNFGLINTATACDCSQQGEGGLKFPLSKINITSNQNINPNLPAGSSLDSNFNLIQLDYKGDQVSNIRLSDIDLDEPFAWFNYEEANFLFQLIGRPEELGVSHIFTIQFTKSNGDIISTETPPITWN